MITLRPYQEELVESIRNSILADHKNIVLCAPTGSGKTVIFSFMVMEHIRKGGKALIVTDRIELMKQASGAFSKLRMDPELIRAGHEPDLMKPLTVAMCETLYRRASRYAGFLKTRTLIIFDEAHKQPFDKLFPYIGPNTVVIGATATPYRSGKQSAMDEFYTDIVQEVDTPDLIAEGYLSQSLTYGVDIDLTGIRKKGNDYDANQLAARYHDRKIYDGVIENYNRICPNTKALLFASNIQSSKDICAKLLLAGLPAAHLDSEMPDYQRKEILKWFAKTSNAILCNIGILTTGFDQPDIKTIILYRATTSLPLFLQMIGRGSRIVRGLKDSFFILDFGNNVKAHNFWESPRTWSLAKKEKKSIGVPVIKTCPKCGALIPGGATKCEYCDHIFLKKTVEPEDNEFAELKLLTHNQIRKKVQAGISPEELDNIREAKGYKVGWAVRQLETEEELRAFAKHKKYHYKWVDRILEAREKIEEKAPEITKSMLNLSLELPKITNLKSL